MKGGRITIEQKSTLTVRRCHCRRPPYRRGDLFLCPDAEGENETLGFDPNRPVPSDAVLKAV